jgi:hypothetical protein
LGGSASISSPNRNSRPEVTVSKPAMQRRSVVLPQPEGPSSVKNSLSAMSSDTRSSARWPVSPAP